MICIDNTHLLPTVWHNNNKYNIGKSVKWTDERNSCFFGTTYYTKCKWAPFQNGGC